MKARDSIWVLLIGILITLASFSLIYFKEGLWYFPAVFGILMIFDYFSSMKNKDTALQLLVNNIAKFRQLYVLMFLLGATIELLGKFMFKLWSYPYQTNLFLDLIGLLFYPLILMSFREMYESISLLIKNKSLTFIIAAILGVLIWEIPNVFIDSWIYNIPYINLEIFKINIIVIIGWVILIGFPIWIYKILKK